MRVVLTSLALLIAGPSVASAHHAPGAPPHELRVMRSVYPDLMHRELRRVPVSWSHLRRVVASRWRATHPCSPDTLRALARRGYWTAVERTWECDGLPHPMRRFLRCIPRYEGGYTHPDVRFGGVIGFAGLVAQGNVVLGPWQVRPGWVRGAMEGRPGTYAGDYWTRDLYDYAVNPVNMARVVEHIGPSQYATARWCS